MVDASIDWLDGGKWRSESPISLVGIGLVPRAGCRGRSRRRAQSARCPRKLRNLPGYSTMAHFSARLQGEMTGRWMVLGRAARWYGGYCVASGVARACAFQYNGRQDWPRGFAQGVVLGATAAPYCLFMIAIGRPIANIKLYSGASWTCQPDSPQEPQPQSPPSPPSHQHPQPQPQPPPSPPSLQHPQPQPQPQPSPGLKPQTVAAMRDGASGGVAGRWSSLHPFMPPPFL